MSEMSKWWSTWAPIWEHIEEQYLSTNIVNNFIHEITSPVLVIGAGQGLIIKYLREKGFLIDGIDLEEEMIKIAKKRHAIDIIRADAKNLPFKDKSYKSVIIASGVIDYISDNKLIKKIVNEALRVLEVHGNLFIAFYQLDKKLVKIYRKLGVIDSNNKYHNKRMFVIDKLTKQDPLLCIDPIMNWTNKKFLPVLFYWTRLGIKLPKELKEERRKMEYLFEIARNNNIDTTKLQDSIPESVPYREMEDIKSLFNDMGFIYNDIVKYSDCSVVKFYRSGIINLNEGNKANIKKIEKDWIIKTEDLYKKYKGSNQYAVNCLNLSIKKGTIFGLLGPNGAGKTTTLSTLCGLIEPTSGRISFSEHIRSENLKKIIGYIPQELALYPRLTGRENLMFFGRLYKMKGNELNSRVDELLSIIGLKDKADILIKKYSTGMKRRLNLAVGLINNPKIILMDEPTVGIDPQSRNHIFELVHYLKKSGVTILYTTHYMEEADRLCDMVAIMDNGKILIQGNPKTLVEKYGTCQLVFKVDKMDLKTLKLFIAKVIGNRSVCDASMIKNKMIIKSFNLKDNLKIIEEVNNISKKFKIKLSLINVINPNLESLFLELTGKKLRDSIEDELSEKENY